LLKQILPEEAVKTVEKERELLGRVRDFVERFEAGGTRARRVSELISHLDDMFLLVVVGEVKAGKSAFINALLDAKLCPEGPLPLTDRVHVLGHGDTAAEEEVEPYVTRHTVPLDTLERMNVVDTPGTNSPLRQHQEITENFLPRADIVFFVTSIDCPLTLTEIEFLGEIRERWKKEIACVLAKIDMRSEEDRATVIQYLKDQFQERLGFCPPVFPVSSHRARDARTAGDAEAVEASGLPAVERYIVENLSESRRILLKLKSPLGAVADIVGSVDEEAVARLEVLEADFKGWNAIQEQVSFAATSLKERSERHIAPILASFENLETRGRKFLKETIRLRNLKMVTDKGRFTDAFEREVVRGVTEEVEARVEDTSRWLGEETHALWERTLSHFNETVSLSRYREEIAAGTGPSFRETRRETLEKIVADAQRTMKTWSVESECHRIREIAKSSLARVVGTEVAAAGLGAVLAAALAPGIGVAVGAAIALGGFLILPARRQKAIEAFEASVRSTRDAVLAATREAVATEAERASAAVLDAFTPFHDFYESRKRGLAGVREEAAALREATAALQAELG